MSCFVEKLGMWLDAIYTVPSRGRLIYENNTVAVYAVGFFKKIAVIK